MYEGTVTVAIENAGFMPEYEALWLRYDRNSFFRSPAHLRMICDLSVSRLFFAVARAGGAPLAALPFAVKDGPLGAILNALPFYGTYGAIIGDAAPAEAITLALDAYARGLGISAATYIEDWRTPSFAALKGVTFITERTNQFIELQSLPADDVARAYHQKTRNLVRKAEKLGVTVRRSTDARDISPLQRAHQENMAAIGGQPKPDGFFELLRRPDQPLGRATLYIASHNGHDCAYLLNFYCGDTVEYYMPATLIANRALQPMNLLIHTAIRDAKADGYAYWNFGGTWPTQEKLRHFKIRWGSGETRYRYRTVLFDRALLASDRTAIAAAYPYFFVVPFDKVGAGAASVSP